MKCSASIKGNETVRTKIDYEPWYRALKAVEPDAYRKAIQYAEGFSINNRLSTEAAFEVERSHVMLACELLEIVPVPRSPAQNEPKP